MVSKFCVIVAVVAVSGLAEIRAQMLTTWTSKLETKVGTEISVNIKGKPLKAKLEQVIPGKIKEQIKSLMVEIKLEDVKQLISVTEAHGQPVVKPQVMLPAFADDKFWNGKDVERAERTSLWVSSVEAPVIVALKQFLA